MKKVLFLVAVALTMAVAAQLVFAGPPAEVEARDGDNTIYFTWNATTRRITEASSSRRLTAGQRIELLTRLSDRDQLLLARGVLKNTSEDERYLVKGTLVQRISRDGKTIREKRLSVNRAIGPGQKIVVGSAYTLPSGKYSVRTDFVRK